jgi:hypothetical protein
VSGEGVDAAGFFVDLELAGGGEDGEPCGVVAPVFEVAETVEEERAHLLGAGTGDDSAHNQENTGECGVSTPDCPECMGKVSDHGGKSGVGGSARG